MVRWKRGLRGLAVVAALKMMALIVKIKNVRKYFC